MISVAEKDGKIGSRLKWGWFQFRAAGLRVARAVANLRNADPIAPRAVASARPEANEWAVVAGESITSLWTAQTVAEQKLVEGKVRNLRIAAARINGMVLEAGQIFSFWAVVGPPWRSRGFVEGRELREGCLIASVGGGLCQLSNALHLAAWEAGLTVIERHAHSRTIPGSVAATGRDATVFWNYKDLRFRSATAILIHATLTDANLVVRLSTQFAPVKVEAGYDLPPEPRDFLEPAADCAQCLHLECVHHSVRHLGISPK